MTVARETSWRRGGWITLALAVFGFGVAGYHPYAEDGGVYVAGVKKLLDPALYPVGTEFVTEHLRFSLFAPMVAGLVRGSRLPLEWVLVLLCFASLWATLFAGWLVAERCVDSLRGRVGAVALLACWLTLPIAGTSLMLMDPYLTARSVSTPLVLLALRGALDSCYGVGRYRLRASVWSGLALVAAAAVHPLMAAYGLGAVLVVLCLGASRVWVRQWGPWAFAPLAMLVAAAVQAGAPPESAAYVRVAVTRYYWFVGRWEWFEWLGLLGPMMVLGALVRRRWSLPELPAGRVLGAAAMVLGAIAFAVACAFAREGTATHLVARMQPLRCFGIVYEVMILLLGAWLGEVVLRGKVGRWGLLLVTMGGTMFAVQRDIYANSAHVEWPGMQPRNAWERAFVWVRGNTPRDAVFALDARYITRGRGEDAQCFRAIAERSALPDYSKDGGEASITPALTAAWVQGVDAQTGLEQETDAERVAKITPLGADWVVLELGSATAWRCPYRNERVKVCRVRS